jgi:16S rRNA (cytosine1402-N4)-methyltransferase
VAGGRLKTTHDLAAVCERVMGRKGRIHPATRVFLALRAKVNDELGALRDLLDVAPACLNVGGRLLFISFHSLEDRLIKEKFQSLDRAQDSNERRYALINKKPISPSAEEQRQNPRSRSAKLRVLERVT